MMIALPFAIVAVLVSAPIIAAGIVAVASRHEDSGRTLAGPPPNLVDAAARRIVDFYAIGIDWIQPADRNHAPVRESMSACDEFRMADQGEPSWPPAAASSQPPATSSRCAATVPPARSRHLKPKPITVKVWRNLPEESRRKVEVVNGQVVRSEKPSRAHQAAAALVTAMLNAAAEAHMERNPSTCLDTSTDLDVLLWEIPAATIRSPDAALFDWAPNDPRPLPASHLKLVAEVVSPGSRKARKLDKMAAYARAGIPFCWLIWFSADHVLSIDIHLFDHTLRCYRLFRTLTPEQEVSTVEVPIRIQINWRRLAHLARL